MTLSPQTVLAEIRVPRVSSTRDITVLETAMLGLTLDERHPVALEIAGTATSRSFLLRATTPVALRHLTAQIQARYPQAEITTLNDDPLAQADGEVASVVELCPGAASYLPLRTLSERELLKEGADPLLGVLAAFQHIPASTRVLIQLAFLPLPATWSRAFRRRAVEHPLEPERLHQRAALQQGSSAPAPIRMIALGVLVALLLLWLQFQKPLLAHLPSWLIAAGTALVHGKAVHLTTWEITRLVASGIGVVLLVGVLAIGMMLVFRRLSRASIYDMRLVDEKTARVACRVRLRLIVMTTLTPDQQKRKPAWPSFHECLDLLRSWLQLSLVVLWPTMLATYQRQKQRRQQWRDAVRQPQQDLLDTLAAAYRQYHTAAGGSFLPRRLTARQGRRLWKNSRRQPGWARDVARSRHLLSVADLATLWHLPQAQDLADLSYVTRGRARTFLVPTVLSTGQGTRLGVSTHAGQSLPVYLPDECLHHNLLAVASTGKGKSTLFQHLAQAAMRDPARGVVIIEPHGDLIARLAGCVPPERRDDVALIDLADSAYPVGINLLDMTLGRERDKAVDNLIQIVEALWAQSYGPRTENVLEYAAKTLAEANMTLVRTDPKDGPARQYTLLEIVPLLRRADFRHAVLEQVQDAVLLEWWQTYYEPLDQRMQAEVSSSVITKLSKFASSRVTRRMLGQSQTSVPFQELIRQGKILLVSTASGVMGADVSALIGATLLGLLHTTLAEQADLPPEQRRSVLMLIDEFQTYSGVNYQSMLAELRKYGGSFGLATQSLAYLDRFDRSLRPTVLANVDHLFAFTMAAEDAHLLHLEGVEDYDVTTLDDHQCYARLSLGGRRLPLFSLVLDAPSPASTEQAHEMTQQSQQRYAHPVGAVDAEFVAALKRQRTAVPKNPAFFLEQADAVAGRSGNVTGAQGRDAEHTSPRKKKRGRGGKEPIAVQPASQGDAAGADPQPAPTQQAHLMYSAERSQEREEPYEQ